LTGFIVERKEEAVAASDHLSRLSRGAIRRRFEERFTARRMAREYLADYRGLMDKRRPRRRRTALENFWRRVLRATLLIKPRSKSPAEAGLKWLSMERLRVNGISSPLTLCRWLAVPGQPIIRIRLASRSNRLRKARMDWADYSRDCGAICRSL